MRTFYQDSQRTVQKTTSLVIDLLRKAVAARGIVSQKDPKRQSGRTAFDMHAYVLGIGGTHQARSDPKALADGCDGGHLVIGQSFTGRG